MATDEGETLPKRRRSTSTAYYESINESSPLVTFQPVPVGQKVPSTKQSRSACLVAFFALVVAIAALGLGVYSTYAIETNKRNIVAHFVVDNSSVPIGKGHVVSIFPKIVPIEDADPATLGNFRIENRVRRGFGFNTTFPQNIATLGEVTQLSLVSPDWRFLPPLSGSYSSIASFAIIGLRVDENIFVGSTLVAQSLYAVTNSSGPFVVENSTSAAQETLFSVSLSRFSAAPDKIILVQSLTLNDKTISIFCVPDTGTCYTVVGSFSARRFGQATPLYIQPPFMDFKVSAELLGNNLVAITYGDGGNDYFCMTVLGMWHYRGMGNGMSHPISSPSGSLMSDTLTLQIIAHGREEQPYTQASYCKEQSMARITDSMFVRYSGGSLWLWNVTLIGSSYDLGTVMSQQIPWFDNGISSVGLTALNGNRFVMVYGDSQNFGTAFVGAVVSASDSFAVETAFDLGTPSVFDRSGKFSSSIVQIADPLETMLITFWHDGYVLTIQGDIGCKVALTSAKKTRLSDNFISFGNPVVVAADINQAPSVLMLRKGSTPSYSGLPWNVYAYANLNQAQLSTVWGSTRPYGIALKAPDASSVKPLPVLFQGVSKVHEGLSPGVLYYSTKDGEVTPTSTDTRIGVALSDTEVFVSHSL